jgi:hypothetical protein
MKSRQIFAPYNSSRLCGRKGNEMIVAPDGFFKCDFCGGNTGLFNVSTGNHVTCQQAAEIAALREALSKYANWENWQRLDDSTGAVIFLKRDAGGNGYAIAQNALAALPDPTRREHGQDNQEG